jgi:hydroxypyruvate isomerase
MLQFAANLSLLFTELPLLERFAAARAAGFAAVEIQFPYELAAAQIRAELDRHGLQLVLHNLPAGNWAAGERGIACDPARVAEFRAGVAQALDYARTLGCPRLNCLAGIVSPAKSSAVSPAVSAGQAQATLLDNLRFAAQQLQPHGITLLLEAINTHDIPGFFVHGSAQALALIDQCGQPNLSLQYDVYHMTRMGEDVAATLAQQLGRIGHIQIADVPGRGEPGSGTIDFPALFAQLRLLRYGGWIGCEYIPQAGTLASLGWRTAFQSDSAT